MEVQLAVTFSCREFPNLANVESFHFQIREIGIPTVQLDMGTSPQ
jgi:hypothetical protein